MTPELSPPSPNYRSKERTFELSTDLTYIAPLHALKSFLLGYVLCFLSSHNYSPNLELVTKSGISHQLWKLGSGIRRQIWKWETVNPDDHDQDNGKNY
ncbi:hypothetical protein TNCV_4538711 [Trichonephila clavipes]|uniref:Uncharacterized protein n=1 Tax=Trichonephila clavipes TaxID=2585209 RepID=A0A8X6WFC8_TRICX|nr:hypothetical protein TNCV_4538711 [Trichonephila clavipes]